MGHSTRPFLAGSGTPIEKEPAAEALSPRSALQPPPCLEIGGQINGETEIPTRWIGRHLVKTPGCCHRGSLRLVVSQLLPKPAVLTADTLAGLLQE
jgi:hypothetical protein